MPRELMDIDVDEISLVDIPAIRKKFLIIKKDKKDMQKTSETDQDNSDIKNLNEEERPKMLELIGLYKKLTGDEEDFSEKESELLKKLSSDAVNAIKGALNILNKFKGDFSEELKDAVAVLAKYVVKTYPYPYPAKKSDEDLEKAGKKISKDTLNAIKKTIGILNGVLSKGDETKKAISILSDLLSDEEKKALKKTEEEDEKDEKINSAIKEAAETVEKLGKDLEEKDKSISELTKRLETLEKAKGTKKQIEGQDEDDGDEDVKKSDKPWPSFDFEIVEEDE